MSDWQANGLMFDGHGVLHACEGGPEGRCVARDGADGSRQVLADRFEGKRLNSPNDLAVDARGRVGTLLYPPPGRAEALRGLGTAGRAASS